MNKENARSLLDNIEKIRDFYIDVATGGKGTEYNYTYLRKCILIEVNCNDNLKTMMPNLLTGILPRYMFSATLSSNKICRS